MSEFDRVVLSRAIAHLERGVHLLKVLSQSYDTIEDTDAGEQ